MTAAKLSRDSFQHRFFFVDFTSLFTQIPFNFHVIGTDRQSPKGCWLISWRAYRHCHSSLEKRQTFLPKQGRFLARMAMYSFDKIQAQVVSRSINTCLLLQPLTLSIDRPIQLLFKSPIGSFCKSFLLTIQNAFRLQVDLLPAYEYHSLLQWQHFSNKIHPHCRKVYWIMYQTH